jgi:acetyl-CoA synthetase
MTESRIAELLSIYRAPDACAAELLCDRYEPSQLVYRMIGADGVAHDINYGELRNESERLASAFSKIGAGAGTRIATLMGKSREYLVTLVAIWRLGAVHVPLFTAFAPPAIAYRLNGSGAKIVICDASQQHKLAPSNDISADAVWQAITTGPAQDGALGFADVLASGNTGIAAARMGGDAPMIHIYTSGTTGNPKGVVVPIGALAAFRAYGEYGFDLREDDVFWCAADPGWAYGLYFGILVTLLSGVRSVLLEGGFTPETTLAVLAGEGVTNFAAAPTVYRALRSSDLAPPSPLSLRCASSAGEPLTPEVNDWAANALGVTVHDHYGQTEAGMLINNHHHADAKHPIKPGSMGKAMPGWSAAILRDDADVAAAIGEPGRLAFDLSRSPLAWFAGYDGDSAKTAEKFTADGHWYLSGDTASVDDEGYFHFSARDDDVIIMAGYRIGPFEVESAMSTHAAVAESAVIAVPDEVRGEVIEAYVVLREGHAGSAELERDIKNWVKTRFAAHAYPRAVHFIEAMPKTPSGKIQRFVLKQRRKAELAGSHG